MRLARGKLEFEHESFGNPFKMFLSVAVAQFPRSWPRKPEELSADGSRSPTAAAGTAFLLQPPWLSAFVPSSLHGLREERQLCASPLGHCVTWKDLLASPDRLLSCTGSHT